MRRISARPRTSPANRLGLDYRDVPQRKVDCPIIDAHTHVKDLRHAGPFFEAADAYGISKVVSMTPLEQVAPLQEAYPGRLEFIAVPDWQREEVSPAFRADWLERLGRFRRAGARLCKFWVAPYLRQKYGLTLEHEFLRPVVERAHELGYDFMVHVADPSIWWAGGGKYADSKQAGTKPEQYRQLDWLLERIAPRRVIAAHMGGYIEDVRFLQNLLDRHPNLLLDSSATKWMAREIARQPDAVRRFVIRNADRILFGSDLVVDKRHDFAHYAGRYWTHLHLWETPYRGESPIEDPDADNPPRLAGLDLPPDVLTKMYHENAQRLGLCAAAASRRPWNRSGRAPHRP